MMSNITLLMLIIRFLFPLIVAVSGAKTIKIKTQRLNQFQARTEVISKKKLIIVQEIISQHCKLSIIVTESTTTMQGRISFVS